HEGFYEALKAVWPALSPKLQGAGNRAVWITGHSLGGALAQLCAAQTQFVLQVPVQGVYTFGQPRVGDEDFARTIHGRLGSQIFRVINDRDLVPRVPLFAMGFRHYGTEIFFDHAQVRKDGKAGVETLADALRLARFALETVDPIKAAKLAADA